MTVNHTRHINSRYSLNQAKEFAFYFFYKGEMDRFGIWI